MGISDRVTVLDHGEQIAEGTPEEVRKDPQGHRGLPRGTGRHDRPSRSPTTDAGRAASPASTLLHLDDVHTYYGHIHALQGVSHRGPPRRDRHPDRGERRRQDDDPQDDLRPAPPADRARSPSTARTSRRRPPTSWSAPGIGHAPEGRRIFSRLTVLENLQMGGFTRPVQGPRRGRRAGHDAVPAPARADAPAGRDAVGRRAADARDRAGADVAAARAAPRRAVARPRADPRPADLRDDHRRSTTPGRRSCSSSRTRSRR